MIKLKKHYGGILIPKEYEELEFHHKIKHFLTRYRHGYNSKTELIKNEFFEILNEGILVPRFFSFENYLKKDEYSIEERLIKIEDIEIECLMTPRNKLQERTIEYLKNHENGIIQLGAGTGKTNILIYHICQLKKKTLILVHQKALVTQWKERFLKFTNIKEEDIPILSSKNYQDNFQKSIVISTVQTFLSLFKRKKDIFLNDLLNSGFGILVSDEVHTSVGAPTFSKCNIYIPTKYNYGLSATPYRWDKNEDIIQFHLGNIFNDSDTEGTMIPIINIMLMDYEIDISKRKKYLYWSGNFQRSRYLNIMKNSKIFMHVIIQLINKLKTERKLLVICERVEKLIDILFDKIDSDSKAKFIAGSDDEMLKSNLIFSTPGKIRDGVDVPDIDCLIKTSPISNVEQMDGRVIRFKEGKKTPIVIDIVDIGCEPIRNTFWNRMKFYEKKEWKLKYFKINSKGTIFPIEKEEASKILKGEKI